MTFCRLILPQWALEEYPQLQKVVEGLFSNEQIKEYNEQGYNVYYLPNSPSTYSSSNNNTPLNGHHIDVFSYTFVDFDLKSNTYKSKDEFIEKLGEINILPTKIIDSGNGIHAYWKVSNLDAMSFLRFQRRLVRLFNTDEAVCKIFQLMRLPNTLNTKTKDNQILCEVLYESDKIYTAEELDLLLPTITVSDESYCKQHYERTYRLNQDTPINDTLPPKFGALLSKSQEAKHLWARNADDRSRNDFLLGHLMLANGFTKGEALSVLVNCAKALQRAPIHRRGYAEAIVDKIWTYEDTQDKSSLNLSSSVRDILQKPLTTATGTPFRCNKLIDNTEYGFRLGQVIGLVAGSGVGKTAFTLNMFRWFAQENPGYHHFFIPLEQPENEIAERWSTMCGDDTRLHEKVHIISNYDGEGNFRHLSLDDIRVYIQKFQKVTGYKVGCIVIDHIGALNKGTDLSIEAICHSMKAFAQQTSTMLVMQSQTSREKAGIGDIELDKDAAYGTTYFECYCDYLITIWQPLKRCHNEETCPTVTAFKFCKIRHKKAKKDVIKEDVPYWLYFDSNTEQLRDLTEMEKKQFDYFNNKATNKRKTDKKTSLVSYQSVVTKELINAKNH